MKSTLIKDTTKEERIALIKEWQEPDDCESGCGMDLFDLYADYINGTKEIAECNAAFHAHYILGDAEEVEPISNRGGLC